MTSNDDIKKYIESRRTGGFDDTKILNELIKSGWSREDALSQLKSNSSPVPPGRFGKKQKQSISSKLPMDVGVIIAFILLIIALGAGVFYAFKASDSISGFIKNINSAKQPTVTKTINSSTATNPNINKTLSNSGNTNSRIIINQNLNIARNVNTVTPPTAPVNTNGIANANNNVNTAPAKVTSSGKLRGTESAIINIVEYSDFECPYCLKAQDTIDQILNDYSGSVSLEFRHFPLSFHPNAEFAAEASECANEQDKFWDMHDALFDGQSTLSETTILSMATTIGLDTEKYQDCLDSDRGLQAIQDDIDAGMTLGVSGTPAFFINGIQVSGAQPYESFSTIIDKEIEQLTAEENI